MRLRKDPERPRLTGPRKAAPSGVSAESSAAKPIALGSAPALGREAARWKSTDVLTGPASPWVAWLLVAGALFLAYWPCLRGDFVWDDDAWTLQLEHLFRSASGLGEIWTNITALQQFYPLTATSFWFDYHLWGFWTLSYHIENVLLHLAGVALFWKLLKRLDVPGASFAAGVAALHPLMVESVAWITERKNVLSLPLLLGALLCFGRFADFWRNEPQPADHAEAGSKRRWGYYGAALVLFLGAFLAKATAVSFPAVLLVIAWWKRGRLRWRQEVLPTLPFWAASIGLGLVIAWLERTHVGARGPDWDLTFAERLLVAGRALWFYAGKLLWPADLCFIYPRWQLDSHALGQWLWPGGVAVAVFGLWLLRHKLGRGPLAAVLIFSGTLFPLLGFFNGYFMRYSFVCDHWAYLSSFALLGLGGASVVLAARNANLPVVPYAFALLVFPLLCAQTWRHSAIFADSETLYRTTLALNPDADLAHNNLGLLLARAGELDEAIPHFEKAAALRPGSAHAHNNLANALRAVGRSSQAVSQYELALKLEPDNANTLNNLALLLATSSIASVRDAGRAVELAQRAREITDGRNPVVLATLAAAFAEAGRFPDAVNTQEQALRLVASHPETPMAQALQSQLELYLKGLPFRESHGTESPK